MSGTNQTREYENLTRQFQFSAGDIRRVALHAIQAAFVDEEQKRKLREMFQREWSELGITEKSERLSV